MSESAECRRPQLSTRPPWQKRLPPRPLAGRSSRRCGRGLSSPEAIHRVIGDEFEGIGKREDHASERPYRSPSITEPAPIKHFEAISFCSRPEPGDGFTGVVANQCITSNVLPNGHATPVFTVEGLDTALHEIEYNRLLVARGPARRCNVIPPASQPGWLLRLHPSLLMYAAATFLQ